MAVYILHIYIHITLQSCIHKAMYTVLYGKFKSVSEVIRTICDFPPPVLWKGNDSRDRQGSALEAWWAKIRSQICIKDNRELLKGSQKS